MTEYIDKVSFLQQERENYCKGCDSRNGLVCRVCEMNNVLNDIEDYQTADVVEVVRCKDCKHYREFRTKRYKQVMRMCYRMGKHDMEYFVKPNDFCSYGERRDNNA